MAHELESFRLLFPYLHRHELIFTRHAVYMDAGPRYHLNIAHVIHFLTVITLPGIEINYIIGTVFHYFSQMKASVRPTLAKKNLCLAADFSSVF